MITARIIMTMQKVTAMDKELGFLQILQSVDAFFPSVPSRSPTVWKAM